MRQTEVLELLHAAEEALTAAKKLVRERKKGEQLAEGFGHELSRAMQALQRAKQWKGQDEETAAAADDETAAAGTSKRRGKAAAKNEDEE